MRRITLAFVLFLFPVAGLANDANLVIDNILRGHILPRFDALAVETQGLDDAAARDCAPTSPELRAAYGKAFDAWISASHLRFGPTELEDRAFGLAFWPDSRGATPRALAALIANEDLIGRSPNHYHEVSIAARGFYALEFLLYDKVLMTAGDASYHCALVQTIAADIASTSQAIWDDWRMDYAVTLKKTGPGEIYRSDTEVLQQMFKTLTTGLQFTSEARLGRPLGTFDRPRPNRSEARRSERSSRHVALNLMSLKDMAARLSSNDPDLKKELNMRFAAEQDKLEILNDPTFAGVANPQSRLKIEVLQQSIEAIRKTVRERLGPKLGVAAGFNALDGD